MPSPSCRGHCPSWLRVTFLYLQRQQHSKPDLVLMTVGSPVPFSYLGTHMILQVIWAIQENIPKLRSADQQSLCPFFKLPNMHTAQAVGLLHTTPPTHLLLRGYPLTDFSECDRNSSQVGDFLVITVIN